MSGPRREFIIITIIDDTQKAYSQTHGEEKTLRGCLTASGTMRRFKVGGLYQRSGTLCDGVIKWLKSVVYIYIFVPCLVIVFLFVI